MTERTVRAVSGIGAAVALLGSVLCAQDNIRFITVENNVKLEVIDWDGTPCGSFGGPREQRSRI